MRKSPLAPLSATAVLAVLLTTGCISTRPSYRFTHAFDPADFIQVTRTGDSTISGKAALKTPRGDSKTCSGAPVLLLPVNDLTTEIVTVARSANRRYNLDPSAVLPAGTRTDQVMRRTSCRPTGTFTFENLPEGRWYILTSVTWEVPSGHFVPELQGGYLIGDATTEKGEVSTVALDEEASIR